MVLAALYIVIFTLFTAVCWHFIYRWFMCEGATIYESLMLTSVFQSIICVACFIINVKDNGLSEEIRENNQIEELYMISAAGFFLHDTPHWQARHTLTSYTLLLHHIVAFVYLLATLFYGKGGSIAMQISFYLEVTTPLLAIRHYLRKVKINSTPVELLFAVLFVTLRFWLGADVMLMVYQKEDVPAYFKFGVIVIYFMSCGLLPGVIRMLLFSNRRSDQVQPRKHSAITAKHSYLPNLSRCSRSGIRDNPSKTRMCS